MENCNIEEIYREYFKSVFLFSLKLTGNRNLAEDITSETFLKAMTAIDKFEGKCDIRVWLCQIAKNIYFSSLRKKNSKDVSIEDVELIDDIDVEQTIIDQCDSVGMYKKLHLLKEPYKEIFFLRTFCELDFKQIGKIFGKNDAWVCTTYHRARKMMKEMTLNE